MYANEIRESVTYLNSPEALATVDADPYWPKWNSPWWHMLLLHEMRETPLIPRAVVERFVASLNRYPLKLFPIHPEDMPPDVDPYRGTPCHCQLGNVYQVLAACGVDVDRELAWFRPWFLQYQMSDGGLNCDNSAYLVTSEPPSSMVGTIAAFEAILNFTPRDWTQEEKLFLERVASFLISRKLTHGSATEHNASERKSAEHWTELCFPRFYLYDVLRGLTALLTWKKKTGGHVPLEATRDVVSLLEKFPDGQLKIGRRAWSGAGTLLQTASGDWNWQKDAGSFPLLDRVSAVGEHSPFLSRQWIEIKQLL